MHHNMGCDELTVGFVSGADLFFANTIFNSINVAFAHKYLRLIDPSNLFYQYSNFLKYVSSRWDLLRYLMLSHQTLYAMT